MEWVGRWWRWIEGQNDRTSFAILLKLHAIHTFIYYQFSISLKIFFPKIPCWICSIQSNFGVSSVKAAGEGWHLQWIWFFWEFYFNSANSKAMMVKMNWLICSYWLFLRWAFMKFDFYSEHNFIVIFYNFIM